MKKEMITKEEVLARLCSKYRLKSMKNSERSLDDYFDLIIDNKTYISGCPADDICRHASCSMCWKLALEEIIDGKIIDEKFIIAI